MPPYKGPDGRWRFRGVYKKRPYSGSTPKVLNTRTVALKLEKQLLEKLANRSFLGDMPTVEKFSERFLEYQKARTRAATFVNQQRHITLHVNPYIGSKLLDSVEKLDIDDMVTAWKKDAMIRTVNTRLSTVNRMFSLAEEWKVLTSSPIGKLLKVPDDTIRFLTQQEAAALRAIAHEDWRSMMFVAIRTGLRVGELRGLQWGDVDLVNAQVHVRRTDPGIAGRPPGPPKGGKSRTVPLTPDAVAELEAEREWRTKRGPIVPTMLVWPRRRKLRRIDERSRLESTCVVAIGRTLDRAGIIEAPGERLGWHTLRHTFASWLAIRGVSLRTIQALLGHASIRQTERYAHLQPNATHHDAVSSLDFALAEPPPQRTLKATSGIDGSGSDEH